MIYCKCDLLRWILQMGSSESHFFDCTLCVSLLFCNGLIYFPLSLWLEKYFLCVCYWFRVLYLANWLIQNGTLWMICHRWILERPTMPIYSVGVLPTPRNVAAIRACFLLMAVRRITALPFGRAVLWDSFSMPHRPWRWVDSGFMDFLLRLHRPNRWKSTSFATFIRRVRIHCHREHLWRVIPSWLIRWWAAAFLWVELRWMPISERRFRLRGLISSR